MQPKRGPNGQLGPPRRPSTVTTVSSGYVRLPGTWFGTSGGVFVVRRVPGADVGAGKYVTLPAHLKSVKLCAQGRPRYRASCRTR